MSRESHSESQELRRKIAALLNEGATYSQIESDLNCGRATIAKVKKRLDDPSQNVDDDFREHNGREADFDQRIMDIIMQARKDTGYGPRLLYAVMQRHPEKYGIDPKDLPCPGTISGWIKAAGMARRAVGPGDTRFYPIDYVDDAGYLTVDGWGPWYVGSERLYMVTVADRNTRLGAAIPTTRHVSTDHWVHAIQTAKYHLLGGNAASTIFTDNGIGMAVSDGHTPQAVRYALSEGTRIVYIPPGQPWRNGRLENWHWRIEKEYWREQHPQDMRSAISGLVQYLNYYNIDRPHGSLKWKAPSDTAPWYIPVTPDDLKAPAYERLEAQPGIIDAIRMVHNDGRIELFGQDYMYVSEVFGGQYLRIRFELDPQRKSPQLGYCIWQQGKNKEPLNIATFNHVMDRSRRRTEPLVTDVRLVDFDNSVIPENQKLDEEQFSNQADRIAKRKRKEHGQAPSM